MNTKIDAYSRPLAQPAVSRTGASTDACVPVAAAAAVPRAGAGQDLLSLTVEAETVQGLHKQLAATPDVDTARVAAIRQQLAEGSYKLDPGCVATAMLRFEGQLGP